MKIPAVYMRGGTSKALFFHEKDLPNDSAERDELLLSVYGSPDPYRRQLDGMGAATSSTSKVAIIGDGRDFGVDVTYDFGQVGIDKPLIDRRGNCGNISSAVGPFAVDEGLVERIEPITKVRFLNTNTNKVITAHVPVRERKFNHTGDYEIPGLPVSGAPIQLDYADPGGAVTGRLLPTGNTSDTLDVPGLGRVEISLVDAANPLVFVRWEDLGLNGTESPAQVDANPELLKQIEAVRAQAGVLAGIGESAEQVTKEAPSVPKLALVGPPLSYEGVDGETISSNETSLRSSMMSMGRVHTSFALTGGICTVVAAGITGSVVNLVQSDRPDGACLIGHPSGVLELRAHPVQASDGSWSVEEVSVYRTARRLFEGNVFAT